MKKIFAFIFTAAAVLTLAPQIRAQVVTNKYVTGPNSSGNYTLNLESYVTGRVDEQETEKATDFILVLDYSGSMSSAAGKDPVFNAAETKKTETSGQRISEAKTAANSGYWTYSNTAYGNGSGTANLQWYYREGTAAPYTYYPVYRVANLANSDGSANNCRALYIVKGSTKWYLQPDGTIAKTYVKTNTSNSKKLFVGTLYKGWSYSTYADADGNKTYTGAYDNKSHYYSYGLTANATGTANSQFYYYDAGKVLYTTSYYYPVMKANNLPDSNGGNNARAFYVERSGVRKYLDLQGNLVDTYDKTITSDNRTISFATLYRGWTYSTITAALNDGTTTGAAGGHWIKYSTDALGNAAYYPLQKETLSDANKKYQVFFIDRNGVKRYLRAISTTPSTSACAYSAGTSVTLFMGNLYTVASWGDYTRYEGLKRAVSAFAEGVYKHANEKGLSHRIALTSFGSSYWITQLVDPDHHHPKSTTDATAPNLSGDVKNISYPYLEAVSAAGKNARGARVLVNFKNMLNDDSHPTRGDESFAAIKAEFSAAPTTMCDATDMNFGIRVAEALLDREWRGSGDAAQATSGVAKDFDHNGTVSRYEKSYLSSAYTTMAQYKRPKTVIIVSDGSWNTYDFNYDSAHPAEGQTSRTSNSALNETARQNAIARATTVKTTHGAKIYCIHVNTNAINKYEKAMATDPSYCIKANDYGKALIDAMMTIVNKIDVADINLTANASVQDVITPEFSFAGTSTSDIKVYTAPCTGVTTDGDLKFGSNTALTTATVTRTTNADGTTTINVKGFDFSTNWCGLHSNGQYSGNKLVITIPIKPDISLVGGTFPTNTSNSIIIDQNGKKVATFPIPEVTINAIHIQIAKDGLKAGDSAIFTIYRKPKTPASAAYETTPYMQVLVTGTGNGTRVTADIPNLNGNYIYKIVETGWSWLYEPLVTEITTEEQTRNPFVFTNTLRDDPPKNDEDVIKNKFF